MKRIVRWTGILVGLLLLVLITAPFWIDANAFRPMLESQLSQALGREVKLGNLKLAVFSGSVTANELSIADDPIFNRTPFVRAKALELAVELWPLIFSHQLNVTGLTIAQPEIVLVQAPSGDWNFSKMGAQSKAKPQAESAGEGKSKLALSVKLVKISDGRFSLGRTGGGLKPMVLEGVNAELHDFSSSSIFPFSFRAKVAGGGEIQLEGKAGPMDRADVAVTPVQVNLKVSQLDLAGSGVTEAAPAIGGLVSIDGSVESKSGVARVSGKVKAEKLNLARQGTPAKRAVELDFTIEHDLRKRVGQVRRGDIHIAKAVATLTGNYNRRGEATVLEMHLNGPEMPIAELAEFLPAMGVVLPAGSSLEGGTAVVRFDLEGPTNRLVTSGTVAFNHTKLAGFNLGQKMAAVQKLAGIPAVPDTEIQTLSARLRMAPEGTSAEDVKLVVPSIGELNGGGTVSPDNALNFKMSAAVHAGGMMAALNDRPIPFLVEGTCASPVFRPDMRAVAAGEVERLGGKTAGSLLKGLLGGKKR